MMQDAFLAFHRQGPGFEPRAAGAWLHRTLVNRCLDRLRSRARWREEEVGEGALPPASIGDRLDLERAVEKLPPLGAAGLPAPRRRGLPPPGGGRDAGNQRRDEQIAALPRPRAAARRAPRPGRPSARSTARRRRPEETCRELRRLRALVGLRRPRRAGAGRGARRGVRRVRRAARGLRAPRRARRRLGGGRRSSRRRRSGRGSCGRASCAGASARAAGRCGSRPPRCSSWWPASWPGSECARARARGGPRRSSPPTPSPTPSAPSWCTPRRSRGWRRPPPRSWRAPRTRGSRRGTRPCCSPTATSSAPSTGRSARCRSSWPEIPITPRPARCLLTGYIQKKELLRRVVALERGGATT